MRTFALIPAAGKSARMGRPKLLLPLGERTVLERVVAAVRAGGVADVLVVIGPHADALQEAAERAGARVLRLDEDTADMRQTCIHGLEWLGEQIQPAPGEGWLLMPADHPTTRPEIVGALVQAAAENPDRAIIVPTCAGRRGHPVWLRWELVDAMRGLPDGLGLNTLIRSRSAETLELEWPDAEILRDLDTPEDYRRLLANWQE
jgi:molybdenum cofactor cytidylyltransferase